MMRSANENVSFTSRAKEKGDSPREGTNSSQISDVIHAFRDRGRVKGTEKDWGND